MNSDLYWYLYIIKLLFFKFLNSVRAEFSAVWTQVTTHTSGISNFKKKNCAPSSISFRVWLALPVAIWFSDRNAHRIPLSSKNSDRKSGKRQKNWHQLLGVFSSFPVGILQTAAKFFKNSFGILVGKANGISSFFIGQKWMAKKMSKRLTFRMR